MFFWGFQRRGSKSETKSPVKKLAPIRVEMPANLSKFDPEIAVGECVCLTCILFICLG